MNMKRMVFAAIGIFVMLVIIAWSLHSMAHINEINQKRREKKEGEAIASQLITTTATTSIWDVLRETETTAMTEENLVSENPEESLSPEEATFAEPEEILSVPQSETVIIPVQ